MGCSDDDCRWDGSSSIVVGGGRQEVVDIWCDTLEVMAVVLSPGRWVQVKHTLLIPRGWGVNFLVIFIIPSTGKFFFVEPYVPLEDLSESIW